METSSPTADTAGRPPADPPPRRLVREGFQGPQTHPRQPAPSWPPVLQGCGTSSKLQNAMQPGSCCQSSGTEVFTIAQPVPAFHGHVEHSLLEACRRLYAVAGLARPPPLPSSATASLSDDPPEALCLQPVQRFLQARELQVPACGPHLHRSLRNSPCAMRDEDDLGRQPCDWLLQRQPRIQKRGRRGWLISRARTPRCSTDVSSS